MDHYRLPGVDRWGHWRSPLRGPWLTSVFGSVLLMTLPIVIVTGLISHIAYGPRFGQALPAHVGWLKLPAFDWPTRPVWLYRLSQGIHVGRVAFGPAPATMSRRGALGMVGCGVLLTALVTVGQRPGWPVSRRRARRSFHR